MEIIDAPPLFLLLGIAGRRKWIATPGRLVCINDASLSHSWPKAYWQESRDAVAVELASTAAGTVSVIEDAAGLWLVEGARREQLEPAAPVWTTVRSS